MPNDQNQTPPLCDKCGQPGTLYERSAVNLWVHANDYDGRHHDFVTVRPSATPTLPPPTKPQPYTAKEARNAAKQNRVMAQEIYEANPDDVVEYRIATESTRSADTFDAYAEMVEREARIVAGLLRIESIDCGCGSCHPLTQETARELLASIDGRHAAAEHEEQPQETETLDDEDAFFLSDLTHTPDVAAESLQNIITQALRGNLLHDTPPDYRLAVLSNLRDRIAGEVKMLEGMVTNGK